MYEDIKQIEVQQLKNKLHNWGYFYKFKEDAPIVAVSCFDEPTDVVIDFVEVLADDSLHIKCHTKNNPQEPIFLDRDDVYYGHLDFITGSIPNRFEEYDQDKLYSLFMGTIFNSDTNRYESGDYWMNQNEYEALKQRIKD